MITHKIQINPPLARSASFEIGRLFLCYRALMVATTRPGDSGPFTSGQLMLWTMRDPGRGLVACASVVGHCCSLLRSRGQSELAGRFVSLIEHREQRMPLVRPGGPPVDSADFLDGLRHQAMRLPHVTTIC